MLSEVLPRELGLYQIFRLFSCPSEQPNWKIASTGERDTTPLTLHVIRGSRQARTC